MLKTRKKIDIQRLNAPISNRLPPFEEGGQVAKRRNGTN